MLIHAIRECRRQRGGEVSIAHRPVESRPAEEGKIVLLIITDGKFVVTPGPEPAVTFTAVILYPRAVVSVIGHRVTTPLKISQVISRAQHTVTVRVGKTRLSSISMR